VRSSTTSEDVRITLYGRRDESAEQVLERYVADTAPPDPKAPEVRDILPYTPFAMPNGQPAVMRIEDLGDDEVVVSYAVALPGEMYAIHFYRTGRSDEAVERYSNLVRNATFVPLIVGN